MCLIREQSTFLLHVAELVHKSYEMGFQVSGGELFRTSEQQALHVRNGRSKTMKSQHLRRLAIDLNFFKPKPGGELRLISDVEELRPVGQFWEGLDSANRWGGNWASFKDAPHFERHPKIIDGTPEAIAKPNAPTPPKDSASAQQGYGLLQASVGACCTNSRDDVETVQRLLNLSARAGRFTIAEGQLKPDGAFGEKTMNAIMAFQRSVEADLSPSGRVDPIGMTMVRLCETLPKDMDDGVLGLTYLRAADKDIQALTPGIKQAMAKYIIDTPLRRAHFLAQIGHESGELRFRAEIANGDAYEQRLDLGNSVPGDGRRFKGRGLIQLTGKANYAEYGRSMGRETELLQNPDSVETDTVLCSDVAGWFWAKRGCNALADADDLTAITRKVNGGLNGLEDRRRLLQRAKALLRA
jgi:predicted chitinase